MRTVVSKLKHALGVCQAVSLVVGVALLSMYAIAQVDAVRGSEQALETFDVARRELADDAESQQAKRSAGATEYRNDPDQSLWGATRIAAYRESLNVHRNAPLGALTIPAVGLEAPIFEGTADLTLNRGLGRIVGTADLDAVGNLGVAGHRDGFFRALKDVKLGDMIHVQSLTATTRYRITEIKIVEPTDVYVLDPTHSATVTLVTCYPFYFIGEAPQRYIVKGLAED